jgi:7-cyano-7-deazaguanine synthase
MVKGKIASHQIESHPTGVVAGNRKVIAAVLYNVTRPCLARSHFMKNAVVLLSGGLDSATVLALARQQGFACHALSVDYGQRHHAELAAAHRVAQAQGVAGHRVITLDLTGFGGSALTDTRLAVPEQPGSGIPPTYVPARNTILLSLALAWAEVLGARDIFIGVNAVDYSGYPDCRPEYIAAFERMANLATKAAIEGNPVKLHAPLQHLSKAGIIKLGMTLGVDYGLTVSCYQAGEDGSACGVCDSCRLRRAGFGAAGVADPARYRRAPLR